MLEILAKIGFDWQLALASLLNFLVVFVVLKKLVFAPVAEHISKRERDISEGLTLAEKAKEDLKQAEEEKQKILDEARKNAGEIVKDASAKAKITEDGVLGKAKEEVLKMKEEANREIERKEAEMQGKLKNEVASLAIQAAEKIMTESSKESKQNFANKMAN